MRVLRSDVVVVGGGLAGIAAAHAAASRGASVALVASEGLCSGSSFNARTWGLGMITPLNPVDEIWRGPESLSHAIESVGAYQSKPQLVDALMEDAESAIAFLVSLGATVAEPTDASQREFIPCFDAHKRGWHGFHAWSSREGVAQSVLALPTLEAHEHTRLLGLLQEDGPTSPVTGVLALHNPSPASPDPHPELWRLEAPAIVLAAGGLAGLYKYSFGSKDAGLATTAAHDAGAHLTNLEFVQLMVAYLSEPHGAVCNEKLWRHARLHNEDGRSIFRGLSVSREREREVLEAHSWHGPFTTERESRLLELAIQRNEARGHKTYLGFSKDFLDGPHPEFVGTYLSWLRDAGGDPSRPARVGLFAHSSNGGIAIDERAATGVPGLYAAGECAGGVHGADRVGGLASVAALVFGLRAGESAARWANEASGRRCQGRLSSPLSPVRDAQAVQDRVRALMSQHALVNRSRPGLSHALREIRELEVEAFAQPVAEIEALPVPEVQRSFMARGTCVAARLSLEAMMRREQSLGSHHRIDSAD